jgi:hypothetical protein
MLQGHQRQPALLRRARQPRDDEVVKRTNLGKATDGY